MTNPPPAKPSLVAKLAAVMAEVERIPKTGENSHFRYKFAEEHVIVQAVREHLAKRHVMLITDVVEDSQVANDVTRLKIAFTFHDGESGEKLTFHVVGYGKDTQDKGPYKALTGALKYALLKTFLIPTGDDPERDDAPSPAPSGYQGNVPKAADPNAPTAGQMSTLRDFSAQIEQLTGQPVTAPPPKTFQQAKEMLENMRVEIERLKAAKGASKP